MNSLPILLRSPKILLLGGGKVALQKASVLDDNNIDFKIISENFLQEFDQINTTKIEQSINKNDIKSYDIIIDATGNDSVTQMLLSEKQNRYFLLNVVDVPEYCDFYFSSLLNYGKVKIAISSDGASPTITQVLRQKIKSIIPKNIKDLVNQISQDRLKGIIEPLKTKEQANKLLNPIYLIGCGLGDVELLTIKAYKIIHQMDIVLYDNLITDEILSIVPSHVEKIFVGKQKDNHSISQEELNKLLLKLSKDGKKKIARLKSGDPFIFGRGYEELEYLSSYGFRVEVINGISSAYAGPSMAGIPLTSRDHSSSFSVVSAHLKGSKINLDWLDLLKKPMHTTIVLMGLSFAKEIGEAALSCGVDFDLPVAIISNASRDNQVVVRTTLKDLYEESLNVDKPAILVFGEVATLGI